MISYIGIRGVFFLSSLHQFSLCSRYVPRSGYPYTLRPCPRTGPLHRRRAGEKDAVGRDQNIVVAGRSAAVDGFSRAPRTGDGLRQHGHCRRRRRRRRRRRSRRSPVTQVRTQPYSGNIHYRHHRCVTSIILRHIMRAAIKAFFTLVSPRNVSSHTTTIATSVGPPELSYGPVHQSGRARPFCIPLPSRVVQSKRHTRTTRHDTHCGCGGGGGASIGSPSTPTPPRRCCCCALGVAPSIILLLL